MEAGRMAVSQQSALEVLTAAQEGISVKSLIDFRGLSEVSGAAQAVATAAVCMVAGIDESVEADAEGLPPRTWQAGHAVLSKPGHFINSLRRFPYAVDGGRLPSANVACARQCMEGITRERIEAEPLVAQQLFHWVLAAWDYCEYVPEAFGRGALGHAIGHADLGMGMPVGESQTSLASGRTGGAASLSQTTAPGVQQAGSSLGGGSRRNIGQVGAAQESGPRRSSLASSAGRSSAGRVSIDSASPSTGSHAVRRSVLSSGGGGGGLGAQRSQDRVGAPMAAQRRAQNGMSNTSLVSSNSSVRRSAAGGGGYPRSARPSAVMSKEEQKRQLQQLLQETRELKSQEANMKWTMKREEDAQKRVEKKEDEQDIMAWRQENKKGLQEHEAMIKKEQRVTENAESREFQEHKREVKLVNKETELLLNREQYAETKENSEWAIEAKKLEMAEWDKPIIEENLEKYRLVAEYNLEEQQREDAEMREARAAKDQAEFDLALLEARRQKEEALQNLEYTRSQHDASIRRGQHLVARPK